ncbi:MAG: hypothetical protein GW775_00040 [Candidatus Magasanikbacteria bacterium]|uniref:Uncharacterized protein n=1 Tax=Candidatus Magasanikbacteria bacterium CG10_big_fil_rev_8_21_14_0_10_38_6 TaxID=1974647 RepID=A0A2M6NZH1_9BACT|nr:hypothetical protein [Candidatus Magasanikbacteria bacterium]PIR76873.1 MAG: hypothetical protein COU30_05515 [Candidatus Magasanikbacteria bacterium CG10_big_fil_rev_8_21_14_0_10_38_6]
MSKEHSVIEKSNSGSSSKKEDTYSYKGWIISDNFFKRMLAFLGYNLVGTLFIYGVLIALFTILALFAFIIRSIF